MNSTWGGFGGTLGDPQGDFGILEGPGGLLVIPEGVLGVPRGFWGVLVQLIELICHLVPQRCGFWGIPEGVLVGPEEVLGTLEVFEESQEGLWVPGEILGGLKWVLEIPEKV